MNRYDTDETFISARAENSSQPLSGLTEGTALPICRIYDKLTDELLSAFSETGGWHLVVDEGAVASATFRAGALSVSVEDGGRTWYAIQVCLVPTAMSAGYWTVSFEARSDKPRKTIVDIAHVGDDWHAFAGRPVFRLTPKWTAFGFSFFNERRDEPRARFEFNLGGEHANADFRNLRISKDC